MAGLARICKIHGSITIKGVVWLYDYAQDKPRLKSEMTHDEIKASEQAKYAIITKTAKGILAYDDPKE